MTARAPTAAAVADACHHLVFPILHPGDKAEHDALERSTNADYDRICVAEHWPIGAASPRDYLECALRLTLLAHADAADHDEERRINKAIRALEWAIEIACETPEDAR